jgi:hypothetical protein
MGWEHGFPGLTFAYANAGAGTSLVIAGPAMRWQSRSDLYGLPRSPELWYGPLSAAIVRLPCTPREGGRDVPSEQHAPSCVAA